MEKTSIRRPTAPKTTLLTLSLVVGGVLSPHAVQGQVTPPATQRLYAAETKAGGGSALPSSAVPIAQIEASGKPCIAFFPQSDSPTNTFAREPLQTAVMASGDFDFYASRHDGCWNVHVISLPIKNAKGREIGYAISHTVTDPHDVEVGHALTFGPDRDSFLQAMRKATADAIRNIRLTLPAQNTPDGSDTAIDARR
jgi:hypothetical protein